MTLLKSLIYEEIDAKPIYYKNYKQIIEQQLSAENIKGSSVLQSWIVSYLYAYLLQQLRKDYYLFTSETGLHLSKGTNLSGDIVIYKKDQLLLVDPLSLKYFNIAPKIVIEIDTKADTSNFDSAMEYYHTKTERLLSFGVEKVVWILTSSRTIMLAEQNKDEWRTFSWSKTIHIIDDCSINIEQFLKDEGILPNQEP